MKWNGYNFTLRTISDPDKKAINVFNFRGRQQISTDGIEATRRERCSPVASVPVFQTASKQLNPLQHNPYGAAGRRQITWAFVNVLRGFVAAASPNAVLLPLDVDPAKAGNGNNAPPSPPPVRCLSPAAPLSAKKVSGTLDADEQGGEEHVWEDTAVSATTRASVLLLRLDLIIKAFTSTGAEVHVCLPRHRHGTRARHALRRRLRQRLAQL
ncbi:hypothetical protein A4X13_0g8080 [Tilletia indica]|uniref:Uncharacterized protein n=1 Tax=Tilletia indica TaxID=43049 RepID=A0A177TD35_9BASI|nr:hypothetical protein A4X13_0g8080 [Tilletia indica]